MEVTRQVGDATRGPADRFTGDVWIWPRVGATEHIEVRIVLFTPGARTAWHRHPAGQVLHVTEGAGLVQSRGGMREDARSCVSWPSVIMRTNATDMTVQLAEERNEQHRPDDDRRTSRSARST